MTPKPDEVPSPKEDGADQTAAKALLESIKSCLKTSHFSDLVIKTREKEHKVHKIIICGQSTVFSRMLSGDWKEANEGVVNLMDDHPIAIEAMINFMYTLKYYNEDDKESKSALFHTRVYEVAEKYQMESLKELAQEKIEEILTDSSELEDYIPIIKHAYSPLPSVNARFRDRVSRDCFGQMGWLLGHDEFLDVLQTTPDFRADIQRHLKVFRYAACGECHAPLCVPDGKAEFFCSSCGTNLQWKRKN
ncbi:hypothetical protein FQN50_007130 [Emmonsiellopsis sp. PD_5]|nr:hypothetical protein FQN50_007130 [Emmonsiellopsis sp. PD_5]